MEPKETLAFVTVVEAGSFTAAARRLGSPKSTVSQQVSRLEERLGVRLLQRTTRRLHLTETGQAYFERCQPAINELRDAERLAQDIGDAPRGLLKVSAPFDFARDRLAAWMVEFRRRHAEIDVELRLGQHRVDMLAEGIDVALRGGSMPDSTFVSRKLLGTELLLCASPSYLDARGRPQTMGDLLEHDTVSMPGVPGMPLRGPEGMEPLQMKPWFLANEWGALRRVLIDGGGIGPNLDTTVQHDLADGSLERVLPQYGTTQGGLFAVYPSRHHLSPKVRVFVDFVADKAAALER